MKRFFIREPKMEDKEKFISAMQSSQSLHHPWVKAPITIKEFDVYFQRYQHPNQKSYLLCDRSENIAGVFNISEIVRGCFQSAYLGFYVVADFSGKGYMSIGLKLVLAKIFNELKLHRIEANIQPENLRSIYLVKKNGFRYEGFSPRYLMIDNEWRDHERWAMTYEDFIRNDREIIKKDYVNIVAYDSVWPKMASLEIAKLRKIFSEDQAIEIQHIGSTAVPGMVAKPIIDIQIAVHSLPAIKDIAIHKMQKFGYEYWDENPDETRMFFVKGMPPYGEQRTHHVHVFELNSTHWENRLLFRDYLKNHPGAMREYETIKMKLAKEYIYDREKYTRVKGKFIEQILQSIKFKNQL